MVSTTAPFTLQQIGTGTSRFPSGVALPTITDASVDPYIRTRPIQTVQVECIEFWPQEKGTYPGIVLLHEWWGLNSQIKDLGARLACEGYGVIIPNLYARIGGMVTGNAEVAEALMGKLNEGLALQDINSCCEFMNTREFIKRNIHGVVIMRNTINGCLRRTSTDCDNRRTSRRKRSRSARMPAHRMPSAMSRGPTAIGNMRPLRLGRRPRSF